MAEATGAPDKRPQRGAVPRTTTNHCTRCALGYKLIKLRRQWVHFEQFRIIICPERNATMSDGSKRGV